jgi:hypothetical protein
MKKRPLVLLSSIFGVILLALLLPPIRHRKESSCDRLLLLVPDGTNLSDSSVALWVDAAKEEGLHLQPAHDSDFLRPVFGISQYAGVIFPDSLHKRASDLFASALRTFVAAGGKLMLVYDAGTLSANGAYAADKSRFSDLAGVDYALYDSLRGNSIRWSEVQTTESAAWDLGIPPGKYYPVSLEPDPRSLVRLRRYKYGDLQYPSWVTRGHYHGRVLLRSEAGVAAGGQTYGNGYVLFVNMPLGYLKANSDGLPLHAFLNYFAKRVLGLPFLSPVPDGVGGLILNWHIDSNAAIKPLEEMNSWKRLEEQGPYSLHITAGPDVLQLGDGRGFNVQHNPISQALVHRYEQLGYEIGSHGGWIHNYFAAHIDNDDPQKLTAFLIWNKSALEQVTGKPVTEYSAPDGNQPKWVTDWLQSHGFLAYYFTGDGGMGPTHAYRDGSLSGEDIWAFPVLGMDRAAGFEEFSREGYSITEVEKWLRALTEFAAQQQNARLIYFHPPGILSYHALVDKWMEMTARLCDQGRFRWYTMSELARFLNHRQNVAWRLEVRDKRVLIDATHPYGLEHMTWSLRADRFSEPRVLTGQARVVPSNGQWLVIASAGRNLQFETESLPR